MDRKLYIMISGAIFLIVAAMHALRLLYDWGITIGETDIPLWASWAGLIIAGYLAYSGLMLARKG